MVAASLTATTARAAQCPSSVLSAVDDAEGTAIEACGVASLSMLVHGDRYTGPEHGDPFEGQTSLCDQSCIDAVAAVVRSWGKTACDGGGSDYGHRRSVHENALARQYQCDPPHQRCVDLLVEYDMWRLSDVGRNCTRLHQQATEAAAGGSSDTTFVAEYCAGTCGSDVQSILDGLFAAGCNGWPAFVSHLQDYQIFCSSPANPSTSAMQYCYVEYINAAADIETALDTALSVSTREAALERICTDCFREIQVLKMQNFEILKQYSREPELCITDIQGESAGGEVIFCLPEFEQLESDNSLASNTTLSTLSDAMCADSMGRCAERIWSHRMNMWLTTDDVTAQLSLLLQYACVEYNALGGVSIRCGSLSDIQTIDGGVYTESVDPSNGSCIPSSTDGFCDEPVDCRSWPTNNCPESCQTIISSLVNNVGCCYSTWERFTSGIYTATLNFERLDFLSTSCCGDGFGGCSNGFPESCELSGHETALSVTVENVPHSWVQRNRDVFDTSIKKDLARILGVLESAIVLNVVEEFFFEEGDQTQVEFVVRSATSAMGSKIQRSFEQATDNTTFKVNYTEAQHAYSIRCLNIEGLACTAPSVGNRASSNALVCGLLLAFVALVV